MALRALVTHYDDIFIDLNNEVNVKITLTCILIDTTLRKIDKFQQTFSISASGTISAFNNALGDAVRAEAIGYGYSIPANGVYLPQFVRF